MFFLLLIVFFDFLSRSVFFSFVIMVLVERLGMILLMSIGWGVVEGESDEWEEVEVVKGLV